MRYLKIIKYSTISDWSPYSILGVNIKYSDGFGLHTIGSFLKRNKSQVIVQDNVLYTRPTIKLYNNGIKIRDKKYGKLIGTKKQFLIAEGQFLLSKIDARNGAFGVVPHECDQSIITGNFWTFDVNYSIINPYFFNLVTSTKEFHKYCQSASVGTTNRHYLNEKKFLNTKIPLPPLDVQNRLVTEYNNLINSADESEEKAKELEAAIENYLLTELGIEIQNTEIKKGLQFVNFKDMKRWGVENILGLNDNIFRSTKFKLLNLKDIVQINPTTSFTKLNFNTKISFVPMESVSDEYGEVKDNRVTSIEKSKGYTKFKSGDLIWARITPCMQNGKSAIVNNLVNGLGCGSTEFHVFREISNTISLKFIHVLFRSKYFLSFAQKHFTGSAGQQRVPVSFFYELRIPVPPLFIQHEVVEKIEAMRAEIKGLKNSAEEMRIKAKENFELEIFG